MYDWKSGIKVPSAMGLIMMVELQQRREELFHYVRALASPDYQQQVWIEGNYPPHLDHDSFGYVITFFFEDTMLGEAPERNLGTILESEAEIPVISRLSEALMLILQQLGDQCTDIEYISHPDWQHVIYAAADAAAFYGL